MKVLSLFDGISCARVALERAGIPVEAYYASEIDKNAVAISAKNWPDTIQLGDVRNVSWVADPIKNIFPPAIDLLIGGSPCQDLSIAKHSREGLNGARSGLFYEYLRILREVKPRYFVLENVASMTAEARDEISRELGVEPVMIDAALVSAQRRKRYFWTNIPGVQLPADRGIFLKDILESDTPTREKSNTMRVSGRGSKIGSGHDWDIIELSHYSGASLKQIKKNTKSGEEKALALTLNGNTTGSGVTILKGGTYSRRLTPIECERLQCLPDGYTGGVSNTQRYKTIGNAFNVEVVRHILSHIPEVMHSEQPALD